MECTSRRVRKVVVFSAMKTEEWSGRTAFILASMGSAIGLGSIWKFPYMVGVNGGGAFLLVYLLGLAVIVLPVLIAEFVIGRRGQGNAVDAVRNVALAEGRSTVWSALGGIGVVGGFLILSFYSVIGGWTMAYVPIAATGAYQGVDAAGVLATYDALLASPARLILWHTLFMAATVYVVARGVTAGIERAVTILMPLLFVILIGLCAYALVEGDAARALSFMFTPDFSKITPRIALDALGLGFFSISVGMGAMITYAAYVGREVNLTQAAIVTIAGDTVASFLAGFAIFPIVFVNGLDPQGGPGLMFQTLPIAFLQMPGGGIVGAAFFVLLFVSALASAISLLEVTVAYCEVHLKLARSTAAIVNGVATWALGLLTVFSFNIWNGWKPFASLGGPAFFGMIDFLTSNLMLPVGAILISLFAGIVMRRESVAQELGISGARLSTFRFLLQVIAPIAIGTLLVVNLYQGGGGE
jgi:neurotransmitter:Na+ symporter, NSS family